MSRRTSQRRKRKGITSVNKADSYNGSTSDFESDNAGSTPASAAKRLVEKEVKPFRVGKPLDIPESFRFFGKLQNQTDLILFFIVYFVPFIDLLSLLS